MKKIMFLAVAAIMMATANVKAQELNPDVVAAPAVNYNMDVNMRALTRYLNLDGYQQEVMNIASDNFKEDIYRLKNTSDENRPMRMQKALRRNLSYAHMALDKKQYRQYLIVLNSTLSNKGLARLLDDNELAMSK